MGEVMEKFQKHFPNTTVEVEVPDVLLEVPMDAMLIEQVLYNLMENAVIHGMGGEDPDSGRCRKALGPFFCQ